MIRTWLAQLSLWQEFDAVYSTASRLCSSRCRLDNTQSQRGAPVRNRGVTDIGDVIRQTGYIWKYPCCIMLQRYVSHLDSNYPRRAWNWVFRGAFPGHLLIELIRFCRCPVHAWDVDISKLNLLGNRLSQLKVVCRPKCMPWIPLFWVLSMLVVQSSWFAIRFPSHIFQSNYLPMTLCLCWIRCTGEIRLQRLYWFFVESIFRGRHTRYVVHE